jgi:type IV secretion system protein VirD4
MLFRIARAARHLPVRPITAALLLLGFAWATGHATRFAHLSTLSLTAAGVLSATVAITWWIRYLAPAISTGAWVGRRDEASQHAGGVATWMDVGEYAGTTAMRRRAPQLRPSLARKGWLGRRLTPVTAYAAPLVRTSWVPVGNTVWSACEEVTLRLGGPRTGKTASLACHGLDAPGALLVTTSRTDLLTTTGKARAKKGRVEVFNPTGLGNLPSTVRWSVLAGCHDYTTALRRAADLIPEGGSSEGERWDAQARGLLAVLMHAAALQGGNLRTVLDWISPADNLARTQILQALEASPNNGALISDVRSIYATNERTLTSITTTMLPALRWLNDATAVEVGDADLDHPDLLDVEAFVAEARDSLYLIGREGGARTLIGALTAEVAHQVRMHAAAAPGGRLDPPMTALLDEAPLTCGPIPLHDWTADMGGRGLTIHIAAQSIAQLRDTWGRDKADAILGNTASILVFGGLKSARDLEDLATLCGTRLMALDPDDNRPMPVMTPQQIGALPTGTALVLRNALRPVVGPAPLVWDRMPSPGAEAIAELRAGLALDLRDLAAWLRDRTPTLPGLARPAIATGPAQKPDDGTVGGTGDDSGEVS